MSKMPVKLLSINILMVSLLIFLLPSIAFGQGLAAALGKLEYNYSCKVGHADELGT